MKKKTGRVLETCREKRYAELGATLFLLIGAVLLLCSGLVLNPFVIRKVSTEKEIEKAYQEHVNYITLEKRSLEFTGYERIQKDGRCVYNCYVTDVAGKKYFVFLSERKSVDTSGNVIPVIKNFKITGRLVKSDNLIQSAAEDYQVDERELREQCDVSDIVIDETRAGRFKVAVVWILLLIMLFLYSMYLISILWWKRNVGGKHYGKKQS